jgi:hypothetical protein
MLSHLGVLSLAGLAACGGGTIGASQATSPVSSVVSETTGATSPAGTPTTTTASPPKFSAKISKVAREQVKYSWRPGCPVPVGQLRLITMTYWGFDKKAHTGNMVVRQSLTKDVVQVFKKLYDWRYPIKRMELVDAYKADDYASIEADNTSAFNCRPATGSSSWSQHAYGQAIDINPRENPWVNADGTNDHRNADQFVKRPLHKPGVINPGDRVVKAFAHVGWGWGGSWSGAKDYQHFSSTGQ